MSYGNCPVDGCTRLITSAVIMCKPHWLSVPKPLRDELWRAYRAESDDYWDVREATIEAANAAERASRP